MENVCKVIHAEDNEGGSGPREWMQAWRELQERGWKVDRSKPFFDPHKYAKGEDPTIYRCYIDPVTKLSVFGLKDCFRIAFNRYMDELGVAV